MGYYSPHPNDNPIARELFMEPHIRNMKANTILHENWCIYVSDVIITTILCLIRKKVPIPVIRDIIFPELKSTLDINSFPCPPWFQDDTNILLKYCIEYKKRMVARNKAEKEKQRRKRISDMIKYRKGILKK